MNHQIQNELCINQFSFKTKQFENSKITEQLSQQTLSHSPWFPQA